MPAKRGQRQDGKTALRQGLQLKRRLCFLSCVRSFAGNANVKTLVAILAPFGPIINPTPTVAFRKAVNLRDSLQVLSHGVRKRIGASVVVGIVFAAQGVLGSNEDSAP